MKVYGTDLAQIDKATQAVENATVPRVSSALAETDRRQVYRCGYRSCRRHAAVEYRGRAIDRGGAIGGQTIGETVEGLARYPINLRYGREWRDSISDLRNLRSTRRKAARSRWGPWPKYR